MASWTVRWFPRQNPKKTLLPPDPDFFFFFLSISRWDGMEERGAERVKGVDVVYRTWSLSLSPRGRKWGASWKMHGTRPPCGPRKTTMMMESHLSQHTALLPCIYGRKLIKLNRASSIDRSLSLVLRLRLSSTHSSHLAGTKLKVRARRRPTIDASNPSGEVVVFVGTRHVASLPLTQLLMSFLPACLSYTRSRASGERLLLFFFFFISQRPILLSLTRPSRS
jgi:hypothetical protein